ncbi:MAG: ATP synthase subunit I [Acidobacteriaceae bacterium]
MRKNDAEQELPEETPGPPPDPNSPAERFYGGAITRILRGTIFSAVLAAAVGFFVYGAQSGVSVLLGAALAYWNFRSLAISVNALGERIVVSHSREKGSSIVLRFISRILLVGLAGYAIFLSWPGSLPGFLVGLCMPVPAMLFEAGYEGFTALRRGL